MSIIGAWPRSFCRMLIHRCPCRGIGAAYPGQSLPTYSSMAASAHSWQLVHSATSMIMFHLDIVVLAFQFVARMKRSVIRDRTPRISLRSMRATLERIAQSFRRHQARRLQRLFHLAVLVHLGEGPRHMLDAA